MGLASKYSDQLKGSTWVYTKTSYELLIVKTERWIDSVSLCYAQ